MSARNTVNFRIQNRYLWLVFLKFSQQCFWGSWILGYCRLNIYFTFFIKEKLHFSLICNFGCCLVKEVWALKVALQFAIRGIVAYKLVAHKKVNAIRLDIFEGNLFQGNFEKIILEKKKMKASRKEPCTFYKAATKSLQIKVTFDQGM